MVEGVIRLLRFARAQQWRLQIERALLDGPRAALIINPDARELSG